jgi:Fe-S-cluster formation regulator IscX/YfhJ
MPKDAASWPTPVNAGHTPICPADLTIALQAELAALADIDARYEQRRHNLENWAGSQKMKERLAQQVEVCHKRDREPHVLRLGQLHERIMALTMFKGLHTKH